MSIKIGSASIDENGKGSYGAIGDQTGKEIKIQPFYDFPWDMYIECPDKSMAEQAASYMEQICLNESFGYDQSERVSGYKAIVANSENVNGAKGEFDCSSLVSSCYKLAGLDISVYNTTYTLCEVLGKAGFKVYTDDLHVHGDMFAKRGGIYLNEKHHVVMALEDGALAGRIMVKGCTGNDVKILQEKLIKFGYDLVVDGDFGIATENAVKNFQGNNGVRVCGIVDPLTMSAIDDFIIKLEPASGKTWIEIINSVSDNPIAWQNAINVVVKAAEADGDLGVLELFKHLPKLIEKIGNKK